MVLRLVALAAVLAGTVLTAQSRHDAVSPVFRVSADLVQFDARFLDQRGHPVTDIRKDEVILTQSGRVVPLAALRFEPRAAPVVESTPAPHTTDATASRSGEVEPWIFLIDDLAMSPDAFARAKSGLLAMLENGIPAGAEVGILRTGELGHRTTQLSADHLALARSITAMRYINHHWSGGRVSRSGATGAGTTARERTFVEGTLGSLNSLIVDLRPLPGRKVVVLLSEFIALSGTDVDHGPGVMGVGPSTHYTNVAERLRRLGRLAAESGVTVHTIDLAGVYSLSSKDRAAFDEGIHAVADELGGVYFGGSNDVAALLVRLLAAEQGQYVLAYVPPEGTFDSRGKAQFIPLTVTVSRPGVIVRTRSGFFTY